MEEKESVPPEISIPNERRLEERRTNKRGYFIVVDGLDAIGKGEIIRALDSYEQKLGRAVFDTIAFSKANRKGLPDVQDFWNPPETYFDTIITAEPTYTGIGHQIRNEITKINNRIYTSEDEIQAYGFDRLIQMKKVVIPALINGLNVIQSRCWAASRTYQLLRAIDERKNREEVIRRIEQHAGNKLQMQWSPDLLIIPTIDTADKVITRLKERGETEKDDAVIFENLLFQERLKPLFEEPDLRRVFESNGTVVAYLNAGISVDNSRKEAVIIYKAFLKTGKVPEKYTTPESALAT